MLRKSIALLVCLTPSLSSAATTTYIRAGKVFIGNEDTYQTNLVIVVEDERIKSVGPGSEVTIPKDATVIDLSDAAVLPGLIDCHTHISSRADRYDPILDFRDGVFRGAFFAVNNCKDTLNAGFTTIRNVGSTAFLACELRDSINEGLIVGPRVFASGPGISMTGGHGDLNNYAPEVKIERFAVERDFSIADGADQVRYAVRAQLKHGVDLIKIHASGGVLSRGDSPGAAQFTVEELKAAVHEAHAAGKKIAAHAHGTQAIKNAVIAGVDSIEHGSLLDDEGIALMKKHGVWLVADIYNDDYLLGKAIDFKLPQEMIDKEKALGQLQRDNFARAVKAGVKVAYGTDAGVYPHGDNGKQFFYMVKYGLTPAQSIRSATVDAAELLGKSADLGSISAGKFADIIAVDGDPLANVTVLEKVAFVMKGGKVVKDERKPAPRAAR